jgi:hypothetical protein
MAMTKELVLAVQDVAGLDVFFIQSVKFFLSKRKRQSGFHGR